jgi:hypothetical protein
MIEFHLLDKNGFYYYCQKYDNDLEMTVRYMRGTVFRGSFTIKNNQISHSQTYYQLPQLKEQLPSKEVINYINKRLKLLVFL